jgi:hypothetical protein
MHSRVGLATPYLGKEWFDLIRACIDEAQKTGLEAWLYDEDRWPSGAAGGLATRNPHYQMRMLELVRASSVDSFSWPTDCENAYVFAVRFVNNKIRTYRQLRQPNELSTVDRTEQVRAFVVKRWPGQSWFNGYTYLDTLNEEAVGEFIRVTHERYRKEIGEHFGKTVPGIFTDEPHHGPIFQRMCVSNKTIPWTGKLPLTFQNSFGYDLREHLPEIFYDFADGRYSTVRYHYHNCVTRMFVEAFAKQVGQWCEQNNLLFTGHILDERPINANVSMVGSAMQFYAYMDAPGIDNLTEYWNEYITVKQCSSVARQMGRQWVLSELYGCTGWDTNFETYKYIGDWQAVLGITLRCPHLSWYSMAGEAKRDYPASIHFHSPWWREFSTIEEYFSRLNVLLTQGEALCDLAVIHPSESYGLLMHEGVLPADDCGLNQDVQERFSKLDVISPMST